MKYMLIVLFYLTVLILIGKTIPQKFGRLIIIYLYENLDNQYQFFLTVLILSSKKNYNDLIKAETVSSKVVLFIVEGISSFLIIIIEINP